MECKSIASRYTFFFLFGMVELLYFNNCNYLDMYSNLLIMAKFISLISYYYEMNVNSWFWLDNVAVI